MNLRPSILIPLILAFSVVGVYLTTLNPFDLLLMLGIALVAVILRWFSFPLAPLLLGFILSGLLEENLRRTLFLAGDNPGFLLDRPTSMIIAGLCLALWLVPVFRRLRARTATHGDI